MNSYRGLLKRLDRLEGQLQRLGSREDRLQAAAIATADDVDLIALASGEDGPGLEQAQENIKELIEQFQRCRTFEEAVEIYRRHSSRRGLLDDHTSHVLRAVAPRCAA